MTINIKNKKYNFSHKPKNNGFSLIEIFFSISIFLLLLGVVISFSTNIWNYNTYLSEGLSASDNGRRSLETMTAEIRTASIADTGAYTINQANSTSFTFYSDIDDDELKEKVRYFLLNGTLKKGVIKPNDSPLSYDPANEIISTLVPYVTNTSIFQFFDKNYDGNTNALTEPINIPIVRLVKITITTDKNQNKPPAPITFSTQISIRNLKDNL